MTALVEIRFEQELWGDPNEKITATLLWYHVPRVGDLIALSDMQGKVQSVTWLDSDKVIIRLIGKVRS